MRYSLFAIFIVLLFTSCGPTKEDAIAYYEDIAKLSAPVRTTERQFLADMGAYVDSVQASDSGFIDPQKLQALEDSNSLVIAYLKTAISSVEAMDEFEYDVDLKSLIVTLLNGQLKLHETDAALILSGLKDGKIDEIDKVAFTNYSETWQELKTANAAWKDARTKFFTHFEVSDEEKIKIFTKYAPDEVNQK